MPSVLPSFGSRPQILLTPRENALLSLLLSAPDQWHRTGDLAALLSERCGGAEISLQSIRQTMLGLRRKLGASSASPDLLRCRLTELLISSFGQPSGTFLVYLGSPNLVYDNYSTSNTMTPSAILPGQELFGTCCASANRAYYRYNQWEDSSGNWHYQTVNGTIHSDNPPYAGWSVAPSNFSTGGQMWANCC